MSVRVGFEAGNLYYSLIELPEGTKAVSTVETKTRFDLAKKRLMETPGNWAIIINRLGEIIDEIKTI